MQKEYDVLRLIEYGCGCYVSSDIARGCILSEWIKNHPRISKDLFLQWIHEIVYQLIRIHKRPGNPSYEYLNPYTIIVSEDNRICLLDIGADSNEEKVRTMNSGKGQQFFMPGRGEVSDVYGLGKVIQYLLTFVEIEPGLSKKEEKKFKRGIKKCIQQNAKNACHTVTDVKKYLPGI